MHARTASVVFLAALALTVAASAQWIGLPGKPKLTPAGYALIIDCETSGERVYNRNPHPEWPGEASGVTVGIGYDCGYNDRSVILADWAALDRNAQRLASTSGIRGIKAKPKAAELHDILVEWKTALGVFDQVTVTRFWQLTRRTYPGFDDLHPNAQAALVSLTFNRGNDMVGDRRYELRMIRDCVATHDYAGMAYWNRRSCRVWFGTKIFNGMSDRREAEAKLMETP